MPGNILKEILVGTFGSVHKVLTDEKYPQNFSALKMLEEDLLIDLVNLPEVVSFTELLKVLEDHTMRSKMMWRENLVKAVIIMMKFSCAGQENKE